MVDLIGLLNTYIVCSKFPYSIKPSRSFSGQVHRTNIIHAYIIENHQLLNLPRTSENLNLTEPEMCFEDCFLNVLPSPSLSILFLALSLLPPHPIIVSLRFPLSQNCSPHLNVVFSRIVSECPDINGHTRVTWCLLLFVLFFTLSTCLFFVCVE